MINFDVDKELEKQDLDQEFESLFGTSGTSQWYDDLDNCALDAQIKTNLELVPVPIAIEIFKDYFNKNVKDWVFILEKK